MDVLFHIDSVCSGRRSCTIVIPDATLREMKPCPKDFALYLQAKYSCVKGEDMYVCSLVSSYEISKKICHLVTFFFIIVNLSKLRQIIGRFLRPYWKSHLSCNNFSEIVSISDVQMYLREDILK